MNDPLKAYTEGWQLAGDLRHDVTRFFEGHQDLRTLEHSRNVAREAERIAKLLQADSAKAVNAALLHDISNVIPVSRMLETAQKLKIPILEEERSYDRSVHQKLSRVMAQEIFEITDSEVLDAIESHTTHRAHAGLTGKILFVADKISWNLPGEHPYLNEMRDMVDRSEIDRAVLIYLNHLWEQRHKLKLLHPWLVEAREELLLKFATVGGARMLTYQIMTPDQVEKLREIDRSEHIDLIYEMRDGKLAEIVHVHECPNWNEIMLKELQERYLYELRSGGAAVGAFDGETLVGFGVLAHRFRGANRDRLQIDLMYVSKRYRRQGVGTRILKQLADEARNRGAQYLYISSTETRSAVSFYRSQGSRITNEVDEELFQKEPRDIHMIMEL